LCFRSSIQARIFPIPSLIEKAAEHSHDHRNRRPALFCIPASFEQERIQEKNRYFDSVEVRFAQEDKVFWNQSCSFEP